MHKSYDFLTNLHQNVLLILTDILLKIRVKHAGSVKTLIREMHYTTPTGENEWEVCGVPSSAVSARAWTNLINPDNVTVHNHVWDIDLF